MYMHVHLSIYTYSLYQLSGQYLRTGSTTRSGRSRRSSVTFRSSVTMLTLGSRLASCTLYYVNNSHLYFLSILDITSKINDHISDIIEKMLEHSQEVQQIQQVQEVRAHHGHPM